MKEALTMQQILDNEDQREATQLSVDDWVERARKAEADNKELQALFDLQHTRMGKATKLWQQATGKHDTLPDLGVLLDWLMGEIK